MTDCSQLLGQLSDLYCGFTWLPGSKTIIFLILQQYRMVADGGGLQKPSMRNQNYLQTERSLA